MNLIQLSLQSAWERKSHLLLAVLSIAISTALWLGINSVQTETKRQFFNTVANTDLIVGARSSPINLLLFSVFHLGEPTHNLSYRSYTALSQWPEIAWAVPISLGDSHQGFRVLGTLPTFYKHLQFGQDRPLIFEKGGAFTSVYDVVLGATVARKLGYRLGDSLILAHGLHTQASMNHKDLPFQVVGILKATGTPVDATLQISLRSMEALHVNWQSGRPSPLTLSPKLVQKLAPPPQAISAMFIGLKNPIQTFHVQRRINAYNAEPLEAILPGTTLVELWDMLGFFEHAMQAIAALVIVLGFVAMLITLQASIQSRRHELTILRALGIRRFDLLRLFFFETLVILVSGILLGILLLYALFWIVTPIIQDTLGVHLGWPSMEKDYLWVLLIMVLAGSLLSLIPGISAYRKHVLKG